MAISETDLKFVNDFVDQKPPSCSFLGGADTTIGIDDNFRRVAFLLPNRGP